MSKNKKPVTPIKTTANDTVRKANTDKKTIAASSFSLFDSLENHFNNKQNIYLIASVILAAIFSYLCFNVFAHEFLIVGFGARKLGVLAQRARRRCDAVCAAGDGFVEQC